MKWLLGAKDGDQEMEKEEESVMRRGMMLMFRLIIKVWIVAFRMSSFPFSLSISFRINSFDIKRKDVTFIHRLDKFACLCQQTLALYSGPRGVIRKTRNKKSKKKKRKNKRKKLMSTAVAGKRLLTFPMTLN